MAAGRRRRARRRGGVRAAPGEELSSADAPAREPAAVPAAWVAVVLGAAVATAALTGGIGPGGTGPDLARTLARAAADLAALAVAGAALVAVLAPGRVPGADRVLAAAVPAWLAALLVEAVARGALLAGVPLTAVRIGDVTGQLTGIRAGQGLLLAGVAVLLLAGAAAGRPARPGQGTGPPVLVLVLAVIGAAAPAATGHAAASARAVLAVPGVVLHVAAALLWVGGLGAILVLARDADVLRTALPRFSRLAGAGIAVLALSGLLAATARLSSPLEVFTTAYGGVLLAKIVLLAGAGALGYLTRRRLAAGRLPVLAWATIEILLLATATGVAATLTHTA
ncbi:CopD family protein [Pseudonocardia parietis]|uniref:Copper export protein n=1 Tax=Pseudonocardia parietis TaxID=570936 RepID=A0ABS4W4W3_9PSEU|nr:CopD family protein [Pseudonocardia parietis]MBP2371021.1 putative copper export protein [Pseudonocardia parietis]